MKLYSYWRSTSAWRVRVALGWKCLEYDYVAVDISERAGQQDGSEFVARNPLRQVPVLEWPEGDEVRRLTQSVAITEYLEERHPNPPLLPPEPFERACVRQAVEIVNSGIQPLQNSRTQSTLREVVGGEAEVRAWVRSAIARGLAALETIGREHGERFLIGDVPTLADVFLVPQLYAARRFEVDLAPYGKLLDVEAHARSLDAFEGAEPERQPDAPR